MSSRQGYRRRERSWEREDRDRGPSRGNRGSSRGGRSGGGGGSGGYRDGGRRRDSRSRSPPRRDERERRGGSDRRDNNRDNDRRDRRDDTRRGERRDYDRDDTRDKDKRRDDHRGERPREPDSKLHKERAGERETTERSPRQIIPIPSAPSASTSRPNLDPDAPDDLGEESEEMDAVNDDSSAMAAFMGLQGFGSTKGKPVEGNQEGAADVKKVRTWRQYMNRRGGFNRPLDKIK